MKFLKFCYFIFKNEITKRENASSKKHNLSKIELFIPLKILNYFFTDTGHSNSLRKKSTYVKSQKIHVLDKNISTASH